MTVQASTSFSFGISSFVPSLTSSRRRPLLVRVRAQVEPSEKSVEIMRKFSEQYAAYNPGHISVLIRGLLLLLSRVFSQKILEKPLPICNE